MRGWIAFALPFAFTAALQAQAPAITLLANAASLLPGAIAPGEYITLFGSNLGDATLTQCAVSGLLPTTCAGLQILVNGKPAPLSLVSSTQVQFQVPTDLTGSSATVQATRGTVSSPVQTVAVAPVAPALYTQNQTGSGLGSFLNSSSLAAVDAAHPAHPGDILTTYGTGFGVTNPPTTAGVAVLTVPPPTFAAPVKLTVGGAPAEITFAGLAANLIGVAQISFKVPATAASGTLDVIPSAGSVAGPAVTLPVAAAQPTITAVTNNASGAPTISSGSWVTIYGKDLAATSRLWKGAEIVNGAFPTALDGVSVKINGNPAYVEYISPTQINVQAPTDGSTGDIPVEVTTTAGTATTNVAIRTYAPGLFTFNNKYVAAVHADGWYAAPANYFGAGVASRPAAPGEVLMLYGTGFGPTNPAAAAGRVLSGAAPLADPSQLAVIIAGVPAQVQFAGLVVAGEYQFNVVVPQVPDGDQPVVFSIAGNTAQSGLLLPVRR